MNQLDLFDNPHRHPQIDGATATSGDQRRAESAASRIYEFMSDGRWCTLRELAAIGKCSESAASARLRDFRKQKFKARYPCVDVEPRRVEGGNGLYEYRLVME